MKIKLEHNKPCEAIVDDDTFYGYISEREDFEIEYCDYIEVIYNKYFKEYDKKTFELMCIEFDINLKDYEDECIEELYEKSLNKNIGDKQ